MNRWWWEDIDIIEKIKLQAFVPHKGVFGMSGSGKSNFSQFLLTRRYGREKLIDLYGDIRCEGFLYSLKEDDKQLIKRIETLSDGNLEPRSFPNQCIIPCGKMLNFFSKLPKNIDVCSFDVKEFRLSNLSLLADSEASKTAIDYLLYSKGDMDILQVQHYLETTEDKEVQKNTKHKLLRTIARYLSSGMFNPNFPKINMEKILKDKKTITSFSAFTLEDTSEIALFHGMLLQSIISAKQKRKIKHPITIYIRECHNLLLSKFNNAPQFSYTTSLIDKLLRQGRSLNIKMLLDSQRYRDLIPSIRSNLGIIFMLRSDFAEAQTLLDSRSIPFWVLKKIPGMQRGTALAIHSAYEYPLFLLPSLSKHKRESEDVLRILSKIYGSQKIDFTLLESSKTKTDISPDSTTSTEVLKNEMQRKTCEKF